MGLSEENRLKKVLADVTHTTLVTLTLCFKRLLRTFLSTFFLINKIIEWLWKRLGWDYNVIR